MNKIQCEYCQSLNESDALECRKCSAPMLIAPPNTPKSKSLSPNYKYVDKMYPYGMLRVGFVSWRL